MTQVTLSLADFTKEQTPEQESAVWLWRLMDRQKTTLSLTCDKTTLRVTIGTRFTVSFTSPRIHLLCEELMNATGVEKVSVQGNDVCVYMTNRKEILKKIHLVYSYL